jgi:serine phosphatase RsbU (regulator of sigma subunit)/anti-sigma regulatory factor (Ser/Thr protein kinase)/tetratricopeptide (TPR) repeat protein
MLKRVIKEEFKVPADINNLGAMRDFVTRVGRKYGVSEQIINAFKMAIDEAGTNIIRHAYRDWEGFITIRMIVREDTVTVSMIDQGHTFDPRKVRDPDLHRYVEIGKKGGLGIFIIRRVIDEIDYRKTIEGNELRLTKKREISSRKKFLIPDVSLTMKTRFSLIGSGILTVLVLIGFVWQYIRLEPRIVKEEIFKGRALAKSIAQNSVEYLIGEESWSWELATISSKIKRTYGPIIAEALIVDSSGVIQGADLSHRILETFQRPPRTVKKGDVYYYQMNTGKWIYEIVEEIRPGVPGVQRLLGTVHLLLDKDVVYGLIARARTRSIWLFLLILIIGYMGIFVLVYRTMMPFKKLSRWVKALGHEEAQDQMEFERDDEIGEIAKAFNEITEKFRQSQVNLAEQERLQKEMQVAQEIQQTLLPDAFPDIEGFEIASYYEAAKEVGGDYFDFVEVDNDTLGIVVADVSGKGVPGSLVMTMIRTALRTEARGNKNAADVLSRVNDFVLKDMKRGMFVTVFYIILDSKQRIINYASAGHNPMILFRGSTQKSFYLNPRGFPIGINLPDPSLFRKSIQSDTLRLRAEDCLIIYTDGITEAMNPTRDRFGDERFLSTIRKFGHLKVDPLVERIHDEINIFTQGHAQSDDITLVSIREKLNAEEVLFNVRTRLLSMVQDEGKSVKEACKIVGVSTSTYYKYKKRFEKMGEEGLKERIAWSEIEEKHISIEDKTKIIDVIQKYPVYGPKRIRVELNSEKYGHVDIDEKRIYDELVKSRLNTKELRVAFVERGARGRRMKQPGTPFLTLDGQIIIQQPVEKSTDQEPEKEDEIGDKKKPAFGKKVVQKPIEEVYYQGYKEDEEITEEDSILDEFFGMADSGDLEHLDDEAGKTDIASLERLIDEAVIEPEKGEEKKEPQKDKEEKPKKEEIHDEVFNAFDELIVDHTEKESSIFEKEEDKDEGPPLDAFLPIDKRDKEEIRTLEQILDSDAGIYGIESEDEVEEKITSSTADELLDEEIGGGDRSLKNGGEEDVPEDGFLDMMEGLGFDRRTVFSSGKEGLQIHADKEKIDELRQKIQSGLWFYRQGLYEKAIEEFKKVLEDDPDSVKAHQCLGDCYFRLGQMEMAKAEYEKVRLLEPENINVLENLGVIHAHRGDYKKAVWQWGEVLKYAPDRKDIVDRIKKMQQVIRKQYL